ncbi:gamma-glutamyl-gamma-aminobutyrate hydrolase family protein [Allorhodopirellula solitaria]|uniref:Putative glutamine amidotransferase n=1 Tax=Allorhodopirellula solitaria TaxID=2527987 RepID=A0A5C5WH61_9BACT|nr:gamma-glutamyl-gamma-aminobutyrate hydrolase family protein [Allorhodopirellula solitaria]TWT50126.1 putative glutamine amidotransferase [Allorhodopirellula solitaria]
MKRQILFAIGLIAVVGIGLASNRTSLANDPVPTEGQTVDSQKSAAVETGSPSQPRSKPLIGISTVNGESYVRAVRDCGGIPVILPSADGSTELVEEYLELLDGLLLPGGDDIHSSEWGEELHPAANLIPDERYKFEKALVNAWIQRTDKPLLGICLGCQWISVGHRGSIVQDIPSEFGGHPKYVNHTVKIAPDSRLLRIFGEEEFEVNSIHHQSVRDPGTGMRVVAKSPDGIVEAIESTDPTRFVIGVQWHPEKLAPESEVQANLFRAFIEAARNARH